MPVLGYSSTAVPLAVHSLALELLHHVVLVAVFAARAATGEDGIAAFVASDVAAFVQLVIVLADGVVRGLNVGTSVGLAGCGLLAVKSCSGTVLLVEMGGTIGLGKVLTVGCSSWLRDCRCPGSLGACCGGPCLRSWRWRR